MSHIAAAAAEAVVEPSRPNAWTGEDRSRERYRRVALATLTSGAAKALGLLNTLLTIPLVAPRLGPERFGLFLTMSTVPVLLSFTDFGLGNGLLTALAAAHGQGDETRARRLVSTAWWTLVGIALAFLALFAALYILDSVAARVQRTLSRGSCGSSTGGRGLRRDYPGDDPAESRPAGSTGVPGRLCRRRVALPGQSAEPWRHSALAAAEQFPALAGARRRWRSGAGVVMQRDVEFGWRRRAIAPRWGLWDRVEAARARQHRDCSCSSARPAPLRC